MEKTLIKKRRIFEPIVITERDKTILSKLADYGVLTTEQLYVLCFPSPSRARKRLMQLWQHGYLKRIVRPVKMGEGSSMYLYLPSRRGLRLTSFNAKNARDSGLRSSSFSDHKLTINHFRICLELTTKARRDVTLDSWTEGKGLMMKTTVMSNAGIVRQISIVPDSYFTLKRIDQVFHYFLEIDRGTADLKRIAQKCQGYLNVWQDETAHAKFGIRSFRVLYVTNGEKRLSNMLGILQKLKAHHTRLDLIFMTDNEAFSLAKPNKLFEPIWKTADAAGSVHPVSLLPVTSFQSSRRREENHHCAVQNPKSTNGTSGSGG